MKQIIVALFSGLTLGVGTVFFALWPLSLLSFAGVLYLLRSTTKSQIGWLLFLVGSIAYGFSFFTIYWSTLPLDWLGLGGPIGAAIIASVWLLTVGLFAGVFSYVLRFAHGSAATAGLGLLLPAALYVLADTLGALLYSVVLIGTAGDINIHFSMGSPGYQLADSELLRQVAMIGGLYGLLFVQAVVGSALYYGFFITVPVWRWTSLLLLLLFFGAAVTNLVVISEPANSSPSLQVGIMSTYSTVTAEEYESRLWSELQNIPATTDVIVFPEDSRFIQYLSSDDLLRLQSLLPDTYLLDSGTISTEQGLNPEIQLLSTNTLTVATSSKEFLMVFGEYMPILYQGVGHAIGRSDVINRLDDNRGYITAPAQIFTIKGIPVSAKLCSDAMSPLLYTKDVKEGAAILFNLASHTWFHHSVPLHNLSIRVGQVRATESSRWYVRAGNDSPAYVLDSKGSVVREAAWFDSTPLVLTVPTKINRTPYSLVRQYILLLPLVLVIYIVFKRRRARIKIRDARKK